MDDLGGADGDEGESGPDKPTSATGGDGKEKHHVTGEETKLEVTSEAPEEGEAEKEENGKTDEDKPE